MTDRKLQLDDWLDDLCVRFIINVPQGDLQTVERICFQVEEAQWYYEDFIRPLDPNLPSMSLRTFCLRIFAHCPLLSSFSQTDHMRAFEEFLTYKLRIPVRGAILLNAEMDSVLLVKGWKKGASWGFPRGKINKDEDDLDCAIREVYEETGYDLQEAGRIPQDRNEVKFIDINIAGNQFRLFVFRDIPMDTHFEPKTRKEISNIQWWRLSDLPAFRRKGQQPRQAEAAVNANKFFVVAPFLPSIRKFIVDQKKRDLQRASGNQYLSAGAISHDEGLTEDDQLAEPDVNFEATAPTIERSEREEKAVAAFTSILSSQPSSTGLQAPSTSATAQSSGQQLLALLHSAPLTKEPTTAQLPPQTPLDHIITHPPFPQTPQHQAPRPPNFPNLPQSNFPLQPPHPSIETYPYHRPEQFVRYQQRPPANLPYHSHMPQQFSQPQHRPLPNPPPLRHPQPLPPNVQKALFTGGPVHSSMAAQPIQQLTPQYNSTVSGAVQNTQFPNMHATIIPPQQKQAPPTLTTHSMALLNAFKTRDALGGSSAQNVSVGGKVNQAPPPEAQELPGESLQPSHVSSSQATVTQTIVSKTSIQELNAGTVNHRQPTKPISEAQRSMLLGIFKSPTTQPANLATSATAATLPTSSSPSAVELCAVEAVTPPVSRSRAASGKVSVDHSNRPVPELNPESNLPFGAMSILARPANSHKEVGPRNGLPSKKPIPKSDMRSGSQIPSKSSIEKPFQPQILKRAQPSDSKASESPKMNAPLMNNSTTAGPSRTPLSFTSASPAPSSDQKQALLSLFGKLPTSPETMSRTLSKNGTSSQPLMDSSRSRVGSLASGNDDASRRSSQAPISPADKGFLLNYLGAVASRGY